MDLDWAIQKLDTNHWRIRRESKGELLVLTRSKETGEVGFRVDLFLNPSFYPLTDEDKRADDYYDGNER